MNPDGRLLSLDTLRGFDMLFIMGFSGLVTSLCALWPGSFTDALALQMQHAAWNGLTIQDTIIPLRYASDFFIGGLASKCSETAGAVICDIGYIVLCWLFLYFLYRKNTFLKV